MKRIALVPITTVDGVRTPTVPASTTSWVMLHDFGNRALVKGTIPDGTPQTANTIADIVEEPILDDAGKPTGQKRQVDINDEPLTPAQRTQAKTFLQNQGLPVDKFDADAPVSRAQLLRFILRRVAGWKDMSVRELLDGWDA